MKPLSLRPFLPRPALRRAYPVWTSFVAGHRTYAVQAPGAPTVEVFDRYVKYLQKERAASDVESSRMVDYVRDEIAMRLVERLQDINRTFPHVLDLGAHSCNVAKALATPIVDPAHPEKAPEAMASRVTDVVCAESSPSLLWRDTEASFNDAVPLTRTQLAASGETPLPFGDATFDAVFSSLHLHWANDLPGMLAEVARVLRPDAPLLGAMLGGDALFELRTSLQLANLERRGGLAAHTSPLADVRDVGGLLQRAGFRLLTVDVDDLVVSYPSVLSLMQDLRAMGESNALRGRAGPIPRDVLLAAEGIYRELHGEHDAETNALALPATFRVIYFIAWKQDESQPQPLARGSGLVSMKDVLEGADKEGGNGSEGGDGGKK